MTREPKKNHPKFMLADGAFRVKLKPSSAEG